jgi:hypothetical protein
MAVRIDALRVAQDPSYAASLTVEDWYALAGTPEWQQLVAEQSELVASTLAVHGEKFAQQVQPSAPSLVPQGPFSIIGTKIPRVQGMGVVTGLGQYTEHMNFPGMLYTRTLRSPHPHAKIVSIDTTEAEKFPGVHAVLHRGNLPDMYKDVAIGSGPPARGLFDQELFEVGAPVAVIAAESEHIGDEAMRLIQVQYEISSRAISTARFLEFHRRSLGVTQPPKAK